MNTLDGATAGTVVASKAVVVDSSKDISGFNNLTAAGTITATSGFTGALTGNASTATKISSITNSNIVQLTASQTLTNKTLTNPVISQITNNSNTITLPTTQDTLVGRATTDTLTNKILTNPTINAASLNGILSGTPTFSGVITHTSTPVFNSNISVKNGGSAAAVEVYGADGTYKASLTSPSLGADATLTLPNATSTIATTSLAETLTNKTLTSPTINTGTISGGTINDASIGATTASTGAFTSLTASGATTLNGNVALGNATTDTIGFYGVSAVAQQGNSAQAAVSSQSLSDTAQATYTQADMTKVQTELNDVTALLNEMRTVLVNLGLMKGSA